MSKLPAYLKQMIKEKREYREMVAKVKALPEDYSFVFSKIQRYMWNYAAGSGMDMTQIHSDLYNLFEEGAASGKHVLEVTGNDVAAFSDELLRNATTYTGNWHDLLNQEIMNKFESKMSEK